MSNSADAAPAAHARPPFIPGLELCGLFYEDAVRPIMERHFPGLAHGAGRLEAGSEVLGFDTPASMDHGWGLHVTLFVRRAEWTSELAVAVRRAMAEELPVAFRGFPTHFTQPWRVMTPTAERPIDHGVKLADAPRLLHGWLGADVLEGWPLGPEEWLAIPEQRLRSVVSGAVYRDDTGELALARERVRWYPHDVWLYLLAAQWLRIGQEELFMGRCGDVGDELGSRVVASRLVREVMRLCLLMERHYAPYTKWFGSAFARLSCAPRLTPALLGATGGGTWREREGHLCAAYEEVARMHNALGMTEPLAAECSPRSASRPYRSLEAGRFWRALRAAMPEGPLQRLAADQHAVIGNTSQWVDSTDALVPRWWEAHRGLYRQALVAPPGGMPS